MDTASVDVDASGAVSSAQPADLGTATQTATGFPAAVMLAADASANASVFSIASTSGLPGQVSHGLQDNTGGAATSQAMCAMSPSFTSRTDHPFVYVSPTKPPNWGPNEDCRAVLAAIEPDVMEALARLNTAATRVEQQVNTAYNPVLPHDMFLTVVHYFHFLLSPCLPSRFFCLSLFLSLSHTDALQQLTLLYFSLSHTHTHTHTPLTHTRTNSIWVTSSTMRISWR